MADFRSEAEVRTALRRVFAMSARIDDPTDIVDTSNLYDPRPPAGDLGLPPPPAPAVGLLITLAARDLLGAKLVARFPTALLPPDLSTFTTFGPLAIAMHQRLNRVALHAVFLAICKALERDPKKTAFDEPISHPNEAGALAFASRAEMQVGGTVCNAAAFSWTAKQRQTVIADTTVGGLVDEVLGIIAKKKGCV